MHIYDSQEKPITKTFSVKRDKENVYIKRNNKYKKLNYRQNKKDISW